ncbi:siroheme synthase [Bacillus sp. AFS076308]|uniref:precorrin-2 dehydrogenase/sirohydrochlorin ferrochelatase family protein n=1 Tax=unclassified Bacillus (in: firmicutes) TaxID=185979 RepID=UPI000BF37C53|nr:MULTISPECIES: NAD(P)-dependent oxidoreductase [unclassified Bacillus (in: firmicutes)]PFO01191.1 siroheme synthase [Bacillus sp. AFS076308]PGV55881.1 siroheme synthase [Bacillus sp. AFS037270]
MRTNYPIMLQLDGKKVVVIGGGRVAERKVRGLLGTGAQVVVISPEATGEIQTLFLDGKIVWEKKFFLAEDLRGAALIFAATDDKDINQSVKSLAEKHQLVTVADDPDISDFHLPAHVQRGRLSIAVSTGGASPILAKKLRAELEQLFDERYEEYLEFLFTTRQWILKEVKDPALKRKLLTAMVSEDFLNSQNRAEDFQRLYEELK